MSSYCDYSVSGECPACINGQCGYVLYAEKDIVWEARATNQCLYTIIAKRNYMEEDIDALLKGRKDKENA